MHSYRPPTTESDFKCSFPLTFHAYCLSGQQKPKNYLKSKYVQFTFELYRKFIFYVFKFNIPDKFRSSSNGLRCSFCRGVLFGIKSKFLLTMIFDLCSKIHDFHFTPSSQTFLENNICIYLKSKRNINVIVPDKTFKSRFRGRYHKSSLNEVIIHLRHPVHIRQYFLSLSLLVSLSLCRYLSLSLHLSLSLCFSLCLSISLSRCISL